MLTRVCDICGRVITDDMVVVMDDSELYTKCNPHTIGITCPKDCDWDLCPSCKEKLYSWVQERREEAAVEELKKAAVKESMKACCHEDNNEPLNPIHYLSNRIREARRKRNE